MRILSSGRQANSTVRWNAGSTGGWNFRQASCDSFWKCNIIRSQNAEFNFGKAADPVSSFFLPRPFSLQKPVR
jgi:hypothetical protein